MRSRRGSCARAGALAAAAAFALATATGQDAAPRPDAGGVRGTVRLGVEGVRLADAGPLVVYLDAASDKLDYAVPAEVPQMRQRGARFAPGFLVVAAGQSVDFPNDDVIYHNVFSYSKPNEFDLGLYPKGESKRVTFPQPGVVQVYCSIHASMNAVIFVAPSPYHALAGPAGAFAIAPVPPGKYRLRTWNPKLPEAALDVEVTAGAATEVEVMVGGRGAR